VTDARSTAAALPGGPRTALAALLAAAIAVAAACDVAAPRATATASPSASSTASRVPASPTAAPTADPATAAIKAFVARVTKAGFSYQASFTGNSRHTTDILPVSKGALQVSGDDVLVRATFRFPGGHRFAVEHRSVGGKNWVRYDTIDSWHRITLAKSDSMGAFASVRTIADVTNLGPVKSGDKTYYRVSFRSAIVHPILIPAVNLTETEVTTPKLILLIDADGRPIKGTADIEGKGRVSRQLQEIVIELTVTFTKVGQPVSIKAP